MIKKNDPTPDVQPRAGQDQNTDLNKIATATNPTQFQQQISFSGNAREYFGIWIVNIILSVITLGIYSAWAKVRRETYFKNNTKIADIGFGYHATGGQILKGRLIAIAVLIVIGVAQNALIFIEPDSTPLLSMFLVFLVPWALNSSMRFASRMTSYRNIRFNWHGTYWKTFWFLVIAPVFGLLTLGLLTPLISKSYYSYFARSHSYGRSRFSCIPNARQYYFAYLVGGILPTIIISVFYILVSLSLGYESLGYVGIWPLLISIALFAFIFSMAFIYRILCRNLMMKSLNLANIASFDSSISPIKFIWIYLSNFVVVIVSIGLLMPWTKIRMYNYLADATQIKVGEGLEIVVDEANTSRSSFGEEFAEFDGVEVTI